MLDFDADTSLMNDTFITRLTTPKPWATNAVRFETQPGVRPPAKRPTVANHKSAEKRNRQRTKRRARNLLHLSTMRTYMKRLRAQLGKGEVEDAKKTLPEALHAVAKAASKGVIHKNTASRYFSRLTTAVAKAEKAA